MTLEQLMTYDKFRQQGSYDLSTFPAKYLPAAIEVLREIKTELDKITGEKK